MIYQKKKDSASEGQTVCCIEVILHIYPPVTGQRQMLIEPSEHFS